MDLTKLVNLYVGREVDFSEYRLIDNSDGNGMQIQFWNITDKPQPTIEELEALQPQIDKQEQNLKSITRRQLLFWLFLNKGIKEEAIFTAINSIADESNRYLAEKSYTGTNNFQFGNPFVSVIGMALGLTEQELQQCFDEAKEM